MPPFCWAKAVVSGAACANTTCGVPSEDSHLTIISEKKSLGWIKRKNTFEIRNRISLEVERNTAAFLGSYTYFYTKLQVLKRWISSQISFLVFLPLQNCLLQQLLLTTFPKHVAQCLHFNEHL